MTTSAIYSFYKRNRYGVLFYTLLFTLLLAPLTRTLHLGQNIVLFFLAASLLASVLALQAGYFRRMLLAALFLTLAAKPIASLLEARSAELISLTLWGLFAMLMAGVAISHSLRGHEVDSEHVYAALSTYLLAGLFFGVLYWVLDQFMPHSILDNSAQAASAISTEAAMYFSFVTLTSLGYGDIVPVSPIARGVVVLEVVGGQLYIAVLVARLVGMARH